MTSTVIQFVRLVAPFTSLKKSSELQVEGFLLKMILGRFETTCLQS